MRAPGMKDRFIVAAILFAAMSGQAFAYLDPGSGSVLTTAIVGFFAAIAYTFRKYFYKIKDRLTGQSRTNVTRD